MSVPQLDPDQRQAALDKAVAVRRMRAEIKQMLKAGEITMGELLARSGDSDVLGKMKVIEVLEAMPDYGPITARRLMTTLDIAPSRRLRGLGSRQRQALFTTFEADRD